MNMKRTARGLVAATLTAAAVVAVPAYAHHSFSIFDASQTKTFTGVVTRVNPDANHLQIFFAPMNEARTGVERGADGKPIVWAVEMAGSAASAQQGISVSEFPAGKNCDSVEGMTQIGGGYIDPAQQQQQQARPAGSN